MAQAEATEYLELPSSDVDQILIQGDTQDDVKVNIAIFGNTGSGRSSFINAIRRLEENDINAAKKRDPVETEGDKSISYPHQDNENLVFTILPDMNRMKGATALKRFANSFQIEKFDAFLIFTADEFTKKILIFADKIASSYKPFFFIRTKIDRNGKSIQDTEEFNEESMRVKLRKRLKENSKDTVSLNRAEYDIFLISNRKPDKWDFFKLVKEITQALPSPQKESFRKISMIQEIDAFENFQNFLKEIEEQEKAAKKLLPNVDEMKRLVVESGIAGIQRMMIEKLQRWEDVKVNLAILGASGVGKSSFINAIRGVNDGHQLAAKTGITETTKVPTSYELPLNPNIHFWDLPGLGTPNYPDLSTFCEKVAIEKYDTFLIVCATRFRDEDLQLAQKVESMSKSFFFVRTKIDIDRYNEKKKFNAYETFDEEKFLKTMKDDCATNLRAFNFSEEKIFLVSNDDPAKWDFERLKKAIVDQLPSKQKESLTFSLCASSKEIMSEKVKILKGRVWMVAAASIVGKFVFGLFSLFIDEKLIRDKVHFYCRQLEFPTLHSDEFKQLSEDLQKTVQKFYPDRDLLQWLKSFDPDNKYNIRKYAGMLFTNHPVKFVYLFLKGILAEMEETALAVISEVAVAVEDDDDD